VRVALRREVRAAAGGAQDVEGFFARLRDVGLLVKERRSERDGALTGYAVALPDRTDAAAGGPARAAFSVSARDARLAAVRSRSPVTRSP